MGDIVLVTDLLTTQTPARSNLPVAVLQLLLAAFDGLSRATYP